MRLFFEVCYNSLRQNEKPLPASGSLVDKDARFDNQVNAEHENYRTQAQFDMQWQEQLCQTQISKKKNNDICSNSN